MIQLRPYQTETRYQTNTLLNAGRHPLIVMDTGTGKTKTDVTIIQDRIALGKRVYVVVPNKEVFDQWLSELAFLNPGYCNDEGFRGANRSVYVCMMISLYNNLAYIPEGLYPDEIHTDEAHHSAANTLEGIYTFFGNAQRLGMTATPLRTDNKPLGHLYTDIVSNINIKEAFNNGYLTKYLYIGAESRVDLIPNPDEEIDDNKQAQILGTTKIIGNAIDIYTRLGEGKPWIVPCCTHEHAMNVTEEFRNAGWIAEHLHGNLSNFDRENIIKKAKTGRLNIITTVGVGVEGMDLPNLHGILWLRLTGSLTIWKQFNGRVLRLLEGKDFAIIADLAGNAVLHGMPDRVYKWSLKEGFDEKESEEKVPFQVCYNCGVYNAPDNLECHWCGADLSDEARSANKKPRQLPAMIDGRMVAITTDGEIQEIKQRSDEIKEKQKELFEREEKQKNECKEIGEMEKRKVLKEGLFSSHVRRGLFIDALEGI